MTRTSTGTGDGYPCIDVDVDEYREGYRYADVDERVASPGTGERGTRSGWRRPGGSGREYSAGLGEYSRLPG